MKKIRKLAILCAVLALMLSFTTVAYAYSGEDGTEETTDTTTGDTSEKTEDTTTVFTPDGTGTVVDSATDEDGKQFYSITTPAGNTFYLIIDLERDSDNVYFLDAVTEKDLLALAESDDTEENGTDSAVTSTAEPEPTAEATATPEASENTTEPDTTGAQSNNIGTLVLVLAVVLIGGGAGYYFKIYRPKHQGAESEDDFDYNDESSLDDAEDAEPSDELPPWEDGGNGDDEA